MDQVKDSEDDLFPWHLGVFDAHCHPTDTISSLDSISTMKARALVIMASRAQDQELVARFAEAHGLMSSISDLLMVHATKQPPCQIIPSFGWHPWFSHQLYNDSLAHSPEGTSGMNKLDHYRAVIVPSPDIDFLRGLPEPRPLSLYIAEARSHLEKHPFALVGEIGIDRTFRIPEHSPANAPAARAKISGLTPGGRDGKRLTPYRVHMHHQRMILKAQLDLAGELSRPVSVHGVGAHGSLFEIFQETWRGHEKKRLSRRARKRRASIAQAHLNEDENENEEQELDALTKKRFPPRICLHSYSGHPTSLKQYLDSSVPATIFFSFSKLVNFSSSVSPKTRDVVKALPDERILVESDLYCAGKPMDGLLEQVVRIICEIKDWPLERGIQQLASNWVHFVFGPRSIEEDQHLII